MTENEQVMTTHVFMRDGVMLHVLSHSSTPCFLAFLVSCLMLKAARAASRGNQGHKLFLG